MLIDVAEGLTPIPSEGAPMLLVTVLDGGRPIGSFDLIVAADPVPVRDLAEQIARRFGRQLARRQTRDAGARHVPTTPRPTAAVVVCTRDRADDLQRCLQSILALNRLPDEFVVVDNASADERTREVVESFGAGVTYIREPQPGLDRARNRGLSYVRSDVVMFTDDDVEVHPDWLDRLVDCFDDEAVGAASGLVLAARLDSDAHDRFERFAGFGRGYRRRVIDPSSTSPYAAGAHGAGASMAFRTSLLRSVGGFPEELDAGMPTGSGGDTYALGEVIRFGHRIVYEPEALAFHHHRATETELRRAVRGYGSGVGSGLAAGGAPPPDPGARGVGGPLYGRYLMSKVGRSLLRRRGRTPLALVAEEVRGLAESPRRFREARRMIGDRPQVDVARPETARPETARPETARTEGSPPAGDTRQHEARLGVSVVIPTRGRKERLVELLTALDAQDHPDDLLEYVVVVDGDIDGTAAAARALGVRRPLTVEVLDAPSGDRHHGNGAGTARNAGARLASHELLLFLDDDVLPRDERLVAAHVAGHRAAERAAHRTPDSDDVVPMLAVVGPCPPRPAPAGHIPTAHEIAVRLWWTDHTARLSRGRGLGFSDFGTGNVSIRRQTFDALGGFDDMPRREDWDFGRRLLAAGGTIAAAPDAVTWHHAEYDVTEVLRDRFREGRGDAAMAASDPAMVAWTRLGEWSSLRRTDRRIAWRMVESPERADRAAKAVGAAIDWLDRFGMRRQQRRLVHFGTVAAYWGGVGAELGGLEGWHEVRRAVPRDVATLELESVDSWVAPVVGSVAEVAVTWSGRCVLVAPIDWGGMPWDRERFVDRVLRDIEPLLARVGALGRFVPDDDPAARPDGDLVGDVGRQGLR